MNEKDKRKNIDQKSNTEAKKVPPIPYCEELELFGDQDIHNVNGCTMEDMRLDVDHE